MFVLDRCEGTKWTVTNLLTQERHCVNALDAELVLRITSDILDPLCKVGVCVRGRGHGGSRMTRRLLHGLGDWLFGVPSNAVRLKLGFVTSGFVMQRLPAIVGLVVRALGHTVHWAISALGHTDTGPGGPRAIRARGYRGTGQ